MSNHTPAPVPAPPVPVPVPVNQLEQKRRVSSAAGASEVCSLVRTRCRTQLLQWSAVHPERETVRVPASHHAMIWAHSLSSSLSFFADFAGSKLFVGSCICAECSVMQHRSQKIAAAHRTCIPTNIYLDLLPFTPSSGTQLCPEPAASSTLRQAQRAMPKKVAPSNPPKRVRVEAPEDAAEGSRGDADSADAAPAVPATAEAAKASKSTGRGGALFGEFPSSFSGMLHSLRHSSSHALRVSKAGVHITIGGPGVESAAVSLTHDFEQQHTLSWAEPIQLGAAWLAPGSCNLYAFPAIMAAPSVAHNAGAPTTCMLTGQRLQLLCHTILSALSTKEGSFIFDRPDCTGAYLVHALLIANTSPSIGTRARERGRYSPRVGSPAAAAAAIQSSFLQPLASGPSSCVLCVCLGTTQPSLSPSCSSAQSSCCSRMRRASSRASTVCISSPSTAESESSAFSSGLQGALPHTCLQQHPLSQQHTCLQQQHLSQQQTNTGAATMPHTLPHIAPRA